MQINTEYLKKEIGKKVKEKREVLNLSQEQLAEKLGYKSKTSIHKIEQGITDLPQSKIEAIAKALKTTPAYLMGWEEINIENEPKEIKNYLSKFKEQLISLKKGGTLFVDFLCEDGRVIEIKTINKKPYVFIFNLNDEVEDKKISIFCLDTFFNNGYELEEYIYKSSCFGKIIYYAKPLSYLEIAFLASEHIISLGEKYFNNLDISLGEKEKTINKLQELFYKAKFSTEKDTK